MATTADRQRSEVLDGLARPAFDEAGIYVRPAGRQLVIMTGQTAGDAGPGATQQEAEAEAVAEAVAEVGEDDGPVSRRGRITGFSSASRRRLRKTIHSIRRDADCLFLTLTWHECTPTPDEAHAALDAFWKRVRRRYGDLAGVWKMEPQKRGVPHFHLIVYGTRWLPVRWLCEAWHVCTAETSDAHRASGVDAEWVRGGQDGKLMAYLSKYMSKELAGWPDAGGPAWKYPGRFWGILNRASLPVAPWAGWFVPMARYEAEALIRVLLDRWGVDLPPGVLPPSLTVNSRGDPAALLGGLR